MNEQSTGVMLWWGALSAISVANVVAWFLVSRRAVEDQGLGDPARRRYQRRQLALSALFVFGCAFRSFLPRAEGQRFCLVGSWWSNAFLGRAVATVAELAIAGQWASFLGAWTKGMRARAGHVVSRLIVPLIAWAEVCSWYTAVTADFRGSVIEESTWALTSMLLTGTLMALWWRRRQVRRLFLGAAIALNTAYFAFMWTVDVPMYVSRVRHDAAAGTVFWSVGAGVADSLSRLVVTRRWDDWRYEMPWMSLYFSVGVWISIALIRAPLPETGPEA